MTGKRQQPDNTHGSAILHRGRRTEFVSWDHTRNGWEPLTVRAVYQGATDTDWRVLVDGQPMNLNRQKWQACIA